MGTADAACAAVDRRTPSPLDVRWGVLWQRVAGNLIHLLLLVALVVLTYNLVTGRRSV